MDELTSGLASEAPSLSEQAQPTSNDGTPQFTTPESTAPTTAPTPAAPPKVNLFELEDFKKYQAATQRQIAERDKRLQEFQAQLDQYATSNMDDFQRTQYEAEKAKRMAADYQAQLAEMQEQMRRTQEQAQRDADLRVIAGQYGIDPKELSDVRTYEEAKYRAEAAYWRQKAAPNNNPVNQPDLGGGRASTPTSRRDQEAAKAFKSGDPVAYLRALRGGTP